MVMNSLNAGEIKLKYDPTFNAFYMHVLKLSRSAEDTNNNDIGACLNFNALEKSPVPEFFRS